LGRKDDSREIDARGSCTIVDSTVSYQVVLLLLLN
jgi:hypothetical protein